jgi:hypothetical protein
MGWGWPPRLLRAVPQLSAEYIAATWHNRPAEVIESFFGGLELAAPYSQAGMLIGGQIAAIDAELAKRPNASPAQAGNADSAEIPRPL